MAEEKKFIQKYNDGAITTATHNEDDNNVDNNDDDNNGDNKEVDDFELPAVIVWTHNTLAV